MKAAFLQAWMLLFLASLPAQAERVVRVAAEVASATTDAELLREGDAAVIQFTIAGDGSAPLYGVDLTIEVADPAVRIAGIDYDETFSRVVFDRPVDDALLCAQSARTQPKQNHDYSLGADGLPLPIAQVKLEIVRPTKLQGVLSVKAVGAMLGVAADRTEIVGDNVNMTEGSATKARQRINAQAGLSVPGLPELVQGGAVETAEAAMKIFPMGGGGPVTTLAAYTAYEVHYATETSNLDGYVLYAISDLTNEGLAGAEPASSGPWSQTGSFAFVDFTNASEPVDASGYAGEFYRTAMVSDDIATQVNAELGNSSGHICNFKTAGPGQIELQLLLYRSDPANAVTTEMKTSTMFVVE